MNDRSTEGHTKRFKRLEKGQKQQCGNEENGEIHPRDVGLNHNWTGKEYVGVLMRSIDASIDVVRTVVLNMHRYRRLSTVETQMQMRAGTRQKQRQAEQQKQADFAIT